MSWRRSSIRGACDCFDLNNACLGFLSALDVAARGVATGQRAVAIVVAELGSRFITPDDPRPFFVFGDGAAAVVLTAGENGEGILGSVLRNRAGKCRRGGARASGAHAEHARRFASRSRTPGCSISPSTSCVTAPMRCSPRPGCASPTSSGSCRISRTASCSTRSSAHSASMRSGSCRVVHETGSVGAASIPISLDRLMSSGRVRSGDRILMVGVGAGLSSGATLVRAG